MLQEPDKINNRFIATNKAIYLTHLACCFRNDPKDTGIFLYEPSIPKSREPNLVLFSENVLLRIAGLKDALNINYEFQFEIINCGTDIVSLDDPTEKDFTRFTFLCRASDYGEYNTKIF